MKNSPGETFCLDYDLSGILILFLKLYPSLAISVINGAHLQIIFRNPNLERNSITLYIYDITDSPFYITKSFEKDLESKKLKGLTNYIHFFSSNDTIRVAVFDETIKNIFTQDVRIFKPQMNPESWYEQIVMEKKNKTDLKPSRDYFPETDLKGYIVNIEPLVPIIENEGAYANLLTAKFWGGKPYTIDTNKNSEWFEIRHYIEQGKQGYLQEQNLKEVLSYFFKPNLNLYFSPRYNNLELTDIILAVSPYIILIESKCSMSYIGFDANIKTKERSLTRLIRKACQQLNSAEKVILDRPNEMRHPGLFEHCLFCKDILKICLVNDALQINLRSLKDSLKDFPRNTLPLITSLSSFYKVVLTIREPRKIIQYLFKIKKSFLEGEHDIPLVYFD